MNKISKNLLVLFLAFLLGGCFGIYSVQAQDDKLILDVTKECDFQYSGDSCVAELKITNNTEKVLDGEAFLHIDYQGVCGDGSFDGEGIEARFSVIDNNWLNFSGWKNGTTTVSSFKIAKGETQPKLNIETIPNLCPGEYTFNLELKGTFEEEEYTVSPVVIGGGGGGGGGSVGRYCGDGLVSAYLGEECDDGNTISGDGCSSTCKIEGQVAGATTEQQGGEQQSSSGTGQIAGATTGEQKEQSIEQGLEKQGTEETGVKQEAKTETESKQEFSLLAAVGNILSFGTGKAWITILIGIIILALLIFIVFRITRRAKRRNFEKNLKK